jgi:hypothetical protein
MVALLVCAVAQIGTSHFRRGRKHFPFADKIPAMFGDPYRLEDLSLPRPAEGYAVHYLGRDCLLDRASGVFLPIRAPRLRGLFASYAEAVAAARCWLSTPQGQAEAAPSLAIVPAAFDPVSERHILIYGVLPPELPEEICALYVERI